MKLSFKEKYGSRKFLTVIVGIVLGLAMAFGLDEGVITTVAGAVTAIVPAVTYIITEGRIDAERIKSAVEAAREAVDAVAESGDDKTLFDIIDNLYADCDRLREIEQKYLALTEEKEVRADVN